MIDIQNDEWSPEPEKPPKIQTAAEMNDREFLDWLLKKCDIVSTKWILNRYESGRILLVCCRGLHCKKHNKLRKGITTPRPLVLWALQGEKDVEDNRSEILPEMRSQLDQESRMYEAAKRLEEK